MQLLRTILIILVVYYAIKLFARYVFPLILRYFIRKSQKSYQTKSQKTHQKVGDMHVNYGSTKDKKPDDLGEYVDYEELKDDN
jgi:hypothetical protein